MPISTSIGIADHEKAQPTAMSDDRSEQRPADTDNRSESWLERFLHRFRPRDSIREDLEEVLSEATEGEDFSAHERAMLKNVLGFHRIRVSDVMVPRADISAVPADTSLGELLTIFRTVGHSRLPAYGETLDEPLGMVHIRDFMDFITAGATAHAPPEGEGDAPAPDLARVDLSATIAAANIVRPVLFVPQSMPAVDLLVRMQASHTHIALVIDEYGGTDGLVSIEDLVEMVVGDIEDEHDETAPLLVREGPGMVLADARASLEEVSEAFGSDLSAGVAADEVDTVGGLVVTLAGRVPSRGEIIIAPDGLEFEVLEADPRRLKRLRITRPATETTPPDTAEGARAAADLPGAGQARP
jgi:CBS domain containing-hemolysin-like protein